MRNALLGRLLGGALFLAAGLPLAGCGLFDNGTQQEGEVPIVVLTTDFGKIYLYLYEDTPKHRENFLKLVKKGFYNGTTFHRIIDDFMIQGGDPNSKDNNPKNDGKGGPGYRLPAEIRSHHQHKPGALAAARQPDQINPQMRSSGSQFYIVENEEGASFLNGKYTVFGETIEGMSVVHEIAEQPKTAADRPKKAIEIEAEIKYYAPEKLKRKFNFAPPGTEEDAAKEAG
jgi:cyclophilin family peptidyl-prolyl cis-trans isomerase